MNSLSPRPLALRGKTSLCLIAAAASIWTCLPGASAQTPVLQYNFNTGTGANTGSATGGALTANGTATFTAPGVSGQAGDNALSVSNSYTAGAGANNSASNTSGLNVGMLSQFTVTMWINTNSTDLNTGFPRVFQLGATTSPDNAANSLTMLLNGGGGTAGSLQLGVNGNTVNTAALPGLNNNVGKWVFVAFVYDGTTSSAYNSNTMNANFGSSNDSALLLGTTTSAATVAANPAIATAASNYTLSPGAIAAGTSATAYLGNRQDGQRGFTGSLDDIQVYNSILTVSQIDAIRASDIGAVPEPSTYVMPLACIGALVFFRLRRKSAAA